MAMILDTLIKKIDYRNYRGVDNWKSKLYDITNMVSFYLYCPLLLAEDFGMCSFWFTTAVIGVLCFVEHTLSLGSSGSFIKPVTFAVLAYILQHVRVLLRVFGEHHPTTGCAVGFLGKYLLICVEIFLLLVVFADGTPHPPNAVMRKTGTYYVVLLGTFVGNYVFRKAGGVLLTAVALRALVWAVIAVFPFVYYAAACWSRVKKRQNEVVVAFLSSLAKGCGGTEYEDSIDDEIERAEAFYLE